MEIGVFTFADVRQNEGAEQRLRDLMEEVELADEVGLDVFGVGEHHRPEFAVSAPAVVLAAAAARTKRIRLTSAVTVLSSAVPIRLYQQFATLDLLSGGRAEMMVGRGSFIESFPLFGFDLRDYDRVRAQATRDKFKLNRLIQTVVALPEVANIVARKLRRRPSLADRLVSIAGDFVPARSAFDLRFVYDLLTA